MKREGRQHGMVQAAFWDFSRRRTQRRTFNTPTTRSMCTKVSTKPNNHSKYTSRCRHRPQCGGGGCHMNPPCKSLGKVKGLHKVRSACGVWSVVDAGFRGLKFSGFSASGVLDYLRGDDCMDHDHYEIDYSDDEAEIGEVANEYFGLDNHAFNDEVEDGRMSFCEAEFVWELLDEDENWFLVEEI